MVWQCIILESVVGRFLAIAKAYREFKALDHLAGWLGFD